ncbi:MAG: metal ABC transporter substrate-binding protein [Rhodospirillales bacterium]|nr:metal ABC transporter substrate-binding protein [Rhodospirillales bacterium]
MSSRRLFLRFIASSAFLVSGAIFSPMPVRADPPVPVIASFSILGDMVHAVGGERVQVTTLVGPDGNAHVYQPTPADARAVSRARLVVVNGLGFEGWMDRLVTSSGYRGPIVIATDHVAPRIVDDAEDDAKAAGHGQHGDTANTGEPSESIDPHAWQSLANAAIYVANITDGLCAVDPAGADVYRANARQYTAAIEALDAEVRASIARLPQDRRKVVTSHDAFGYFAAAYGMQFIAPEGVSTESEASAKDVAKLIRQIRSQHIPAVFMENVTDPRLIEQIRRETSAVIGGTLYSDALSPPDGPAPTYLDMFRNNVAALTKALAS